MRPHLQVPRCGSAGYSIQTGLDDRIVGGASQVSVASASLPEGYRLLQTAYLALRFVDVLRINERDFDIRLHDVSRSGNAFVWRFRCRELVLSQDAGLPAWRSHDGNMALPDMVVDKPVLDRSQNGAWSRGHVCVRMAGDILGAIEECVLVALTCSVLLKNLVS